MSRGNHAHIDFDRPGASEAFELLLLHRAQQFWLQFQADVPDLIQKQRAPIRKLESALFLHQGSGKRSPLMPEEFALQQAGRNRRAIQFHEIAVVPRTEFVNRPRDQFLSGPGLAGDQHCGVGGSHYLHLRKDRAQAAMPPHNCVQK